MVIWINYGDTFTVILPASVVMKPGIVASTIVDLTSDPPRLLRAGPLSVEELAQIVPEIVG